MATFGDKFKEDIQRVVSQIEMLSQRHYTVDELKEVITVAGTKLELFLKSVVFPNIVSNKPSVVFIDELLKHGMLPSEVDTLHELRKAYNAAKHKPSYVPSLLEVSDLLSRVNVVADNLINLNLGITRNYIRPGYKRIFWIAGWDHYIGGDTEVHIFLPGELGPFFAAQSLDLMYIDMSAWDTVKSLLSQVGNLKSGKGIIPENQYQAFASDEDFLDALVFEGDYRDLITILAQHEKRNDLLPFLMRHADERSMLQAVLFAAVDVAVNTNKQEAYQVAEEIKKQAIEVYAVPSDYRGLDYLARGITDLLFMVERSAWSSITGPIWITEHNFEVEKKTGMAVHKNYKVFIDSNATIRMIEP